MFSEEFAGPFVVGFGGSPLGAELAEGISYSVLVDDGAPETLVSDPGDSLVIGGRLFRCFSNGGGCVRAVQDIEISPAAVQAIAIVVDRFDSSGKVGAENEPVEGDIATFDFRLDVGCIEPPCVLRAFWEVRRVDDGVPTVGKRQVTDIAVDVGLKPGDAVEFQADFPEGIVEELEL